MACCCGLCVPNMTITKANAKENLGELICLSIAKAKAKYNLQIFICNYFRADGTIWLKKMAYSQNRGGPAISEYLIPWGYLWRRGGITGVERYRCILRSAANNLGEIPQNMGAQILWFKEFFWRRNTLGLVPSSHPHSLGYACTLHAPTSPLLIPIRNDFLNMLMQPEFLGSQVPQRQLLR